MGVLTITSLYDFKLFQESIVHSCPRWNHRIFMMAFAHSNCPRVCKRFFATKIINGFIRDSTTKKKNRDFNLSPWRLQIFWKKSDIFWRPGVEADTNRGPWIGSLHGISFIGSQPWSFRTTRKDERMASELGTQRFCFRCFWLFATLWSCALGSGKSKGTRASMASRWCGMSFVWWQAEEQNCLEANDLATSWSQLPSCGTFSDQSICTCFAQLAKESQTWQGIETNRVGSVTWQNQST